MIAADDKIPFWPEVRKRMDAYDCRSTFNLAVWGGGRTGSVENLLKRADSSTNN